jgi:hypothetical protein
MRDAKQSLKFKKIAICGTLFGCFHYVVSIDFSVGLAMVATEESPKKQ